MTAKDFLELIPRYGLPIVFLGLVLWKLWPLLERLILSQQALSKEMFEMGQQRWTEAAREFTRVSDKQNEVLERMARKLEEIHSDVRNKK